MPKTKKPITPENMQKMAVRLIKLIDSLGMFHMINIYAGGKHYTSDYNNKNPDMQEVKVESDTIYYVQDTNMDKIPVEYNNPKTLTMTFEGPLYDALNYDSTDKTMEKINKIFDEYGLYAEMGYAWSLAAYE